MSNPRYRNLLRTLYTAVLSSRLTTAEIRALSHELRGGQLSDELAFMLDQSLRHFAGDMGEGSVSEIVASIERLAKSRKLTRAALSNVMQSLGWQQVSPLKGVRSLIQNFVDTSSSSKIDKLIEILEAAGESDNYLTGISRSRG